MTKIQLKSRKREEIGKRIGELRSQGLVPAVLYGNKIDNQNLWIGYDDFKKVFTESGESTLIEFEIEGAGKTNVLIHDVQRDPVTGKIIHVDLFQINMLERIDTEVALHFVGESPAVREMGGILIKSADVLPISCMPGDLPSHLEVDISLIGDFDTHLKVSDIKVSDKVKIEADPEMVVALVKPPRTEDELSKLSEKVEEDVTKVEGVVKAEPEEKKEGEAKK